MRIPTLPRQAAVAHILVQASTAYQNRQIKLRIENSLVMLVFFSQVSNVLDASAKI